MLQGGLDVHELHEEAKDREDILLQALAALGCNELCLMYLLAPFVPVENQGCPVDSDVFVHAILPSQKYEDVCCGIVARCCMLRFHQQSPCSSND